MPVSLYVGHSQLKKKIMLWTQKNGLVEKPLKCFSGSEFSKWGSYLHFTLPMQKIEPHV